MTTTPDPEVIKTAELIQSQLKEIGLQVDLKSVDQATLISLAIAGDHDAMLFRNHPTGDPDSQYVWWQSESVVNFGRITSPDIDRLLEEGRAETDATKRQEIYEDLNRTFTDEAWNIWLSYTPWAVAMAPEVHGIYGPDLPAPDPRHPTSPGSETSSKPNPGLATATACSNVDDKN